MPVLLDEPRASCSASPAATALGELDPLRPRAPSASRRRRTPRRRGRRTAAPGRARPARRPTCRAAPQSDTSSPASRICRAQLGRPARRARRSGSPRSSARRRASSGSDSIWRRVSPTSESPWRRAWSRKVRGVLARQRRQPERQLRQVDGDRVAVDAVEAALGDEPAGEDDLVLVGRDLRPLAVDAPRPRRGRRRAGGRPRRGTRPSPSPGRRPSGRGSAPASARRRPRPEAVEDRLERRADDRLGERARRVVRARPAALVARLEDHRARRARGRASPPCRSPRPSAACSVLERRRVLDRRGDLRRQLAVGAVLRATSPACRARRRAARRGRRRRRAVAALRP